MIGFPAQLEEHEMTELMNGESCLAKRLLFKTIEQTKLEKEYLYPTDHTPAFYFLHVLSSPHKIVHIPIDE
ncbi:MAG: hypothetical protein ACOX6S_13495 [Clostridia bacterium]